MVMTKRSHAFSLVELLIVLVITAILGGVAITALWIFVNGFSQSDDYIAGRLEIENIFQQISPIITNAGLGMPNNKKESGSFSASFKGQGTSNPVMAFMGDINRDDMSWGGPVTVSTSVDISFAANADPDNDRISVGSVLYCAWGIPTGVKIRPIIRDAAGNPKEMFNGPLEAVSQDRAYWSSDTGTLVLTTINASDIDTLENFSYEGRNIGIIPTSNPGTRGADLRSWILFPSLRIPMLIHFNSNSIGKVSVGTALEGRLEIQLAPYSFNGAPAGKEVLLGGGINGYEEIHLIQAARFYVNSDREFVRETFTSGLTVGRREVLGRNIAAACFRFDSTNRLLTLYLAARGSERNPASGIGVPVGWPSADAPVSNYFTAGDLHYRLMVESMTWRVRN